MAFNFNAPIIFMRRAGTPEDPFLSKTDTRMIKNGQIFLEEVPDFFNKVTINGYTEITSGTPTSSQFLVDYQFGFVTFNQSKNNTVVTATYLGTGVVLTSANRVYTQTDADGNVTQTLQDLVDAIQQISGSTISSNLTVIGNLSVNGTVDKPLQMLSSNGITFGNKYRIRWNSSQNSLDFEKL